MLYYHLYDMFLFNIFVLCCTAVLVNSEEEAPPPNIMIKRYEMCKDFLDTPVKFTATIVKKEPTVFLISGEGSTPYDIGDNVILHFVAETYDNGEWNTVLKLDEKDPCQLLNDYVGDTWHDIEKQLKIPVGECPIPKGSYAMKDYVFDLKNVISVSSIPKGRLRIQANATQGDELIVCVEAEVESK